MVNLITDGDMFTVPADILINPVNRYGISGAGLAKEFKKRYPMQEAEWRNRVNKTYNGFPMPKDTLCIVESLNFIVYFPTKHHPQDHRSDTRLIRNNLEILKGDLDKMSNNSDLTINMPALGCGLGGLDFEGWLKPLIYEMFEHEPYTINLFEPK